MPDAPLTLRSAAVSFFLTGILGGGVTAGFDHLVWTREHDREQREAWCAQTGDFEKELAESMGQEDYWGEEFIYDKIYHAPSEDVRQHWHNYRNAQAKERVEDSWFKAELRQYFDRPRELAYDTALAGLERLDVEAEGHWYGPVTPDMVKLDSRHTEEGYWPQEPLVDSLLSGIVRFRQERCADYGATPARGGAATR